MLYPTELRAQTLYYKELRHIRNPLLDEAASPQDWWDRRHREGARGNHRAHGILWGFPAVWLELSFYAPVWRISS